MREDRIDQFLLRRFEIHRDDKTLNEFGDFRTDHVSAEQLAGFRIKDRFDKPFGFAQCDGLAIALKREAADLDLPARFFRSTLRHTDSGHLRVAIGAAGDLGLVHDVRVLAGNPNIEFARRQGTHHAVGIELPDTILLRQI